MRGSYWGGAAHAADWYTTIAAMAGASTDNSGPLPPDGVTLFEAITQNATSPRTEVVLQIMSNSSENGFEAPSPEWCATANSGDVALCTPPEYVLASSPPPPRPHPGLVKCNYTDPLQQFDVNVSGPGSICSGGQGPSLCWNVQKSEDRLILWPFVQGQANSKFAIIEGKIEGLHGDCVLAEGSGEQLLLGDCTDPSASGWSYDSTSKTVQHDGQCVVAIPAPPAPPAPIGLELGVLIQGQYKLIMG